jgi:outer membrane protein assembly factor BamB
MPLEVISVQHPRSLAILLAALLAAYAPASSAAGSGPGAAPPVADYATYHFDNARLGWNPRETRLTARNVNRRDFGLRWRASVDGQTYTQPLYLHAVAIAGKGTRDVVVVATENDTVYALDAATGTKLWTRSVVGPRPGARAVDVRTITQDCLSVVPTVGVSSTPVIDRASGTVYVVSKSMLPRAGAAPEYHHYLFALALESGKDRHAPVEITGTAHLTSRGLFSFGPYWKHNLRRLFGDTLRFDPKWQYNRTALLLDHGLIYFGFGSHCDIPSAHGWVFAYRAGTLEQTGSFVTTRDWQAVNNGGVWQAGFGIAADAAGNLYFQTGNGPFSANEGGANYGDSSLKLSPGLGSVLDYFTPYTQAELEENDADFGGSGVVVLPDQPGAIPHLSVVTSKIRAIFLLNRDDMGKFTPGGPDRVVQMIGDDHDRADWCIGTCGGPAYYAGPKGQFVFDVWALDALRAYRLDLLPHPHLVETAHSPNIFPGSGGAIPSVSSNGKLPGTGIVWATTRPNINDVNTKPIMLYAYDAEDVSKLLFSAPVGLWPNKVGHPFLTPTIANGSVYVGGYSAVTAFGLKR